MERTITLPTASYRDEPVRGQITIRYDRGRLSFMGEIFPAHKRPRDAFQSGQCQETIRLLYPDRADVARIATLWERWHLNDMRAGCVHQRAFGWNRLRIDPSKPTDTYGVHFPGQQSPSWNMLTWVRRDEHPRGLLAFPCPVCGYRYGSQWLREDVPPAILAEIFGAPLPPHTGEPPAYLAAGAW